MYSNSHIDSLGGKEVLFKITTNLYQRIFRHPSLKLHFHSIPQKKLIRGIVEFMYLSLDSSSNYTGMHPIEIHKHMFITEEIFELRESILKEVFDELDIDPELREKWLKIDNAFKPGIVKKKFSECEFASPKKRK